MREMHLRHQRAIPISESRSGEDHKSPLNSGPVSPAGLDLPQALLTSWRPVFPPDRALFVCAHRAGAANFAERGKLATIEAGPPGRGRELARCQGHGATRVRDQLPDLARPRVILSERFEMSDQGGFGMAQRLDGAPGGEQRASIAVARPVPVRIPLR